MKTVGIDGGRILASISGNSGPCVKPYAVKSFSLDLVTERPTATSMNTVLAANRRQPKVGKKATDDGEPMWLKAAASVLDFSATDGEPCSALTAAEVGEEPQWLADAASALGIDRQTSCVRGHAPAKPRTAKHKRRA